MDFFSIVTLLGGLAFFLYGMHVMTMGLEKLTGGRLERTLKKMTSNPFKSIVLGAGITIAIQSSSALTVMLVGLVNSGIMQLHESICIIMGSNIGTTLTSWILSLSGIQSDSFFLKMLKPEAFSPVIALIGIMMIMLSKNGKKKDIGNVMVGFGVLMFGMTTMSGAVSPLADMPEFSSILTMFSNPILGVLTGAIFTGIIQSSAASVGILQALSLTGELSFGMAIPIIMGQNIGTCVTAIISSFGVSKNAKRVAVVHVLFNVFGTIILMAGFYGLNFIFRFPIVEETITPFGIAICHSIFNVATTAILLPFSRQLEKLACILVRDKPEEKKMFALLEDRFLQTPSFAVEQSRAVSVQMADLAFENFKLSVDLLRNYDEKKDRLVVENEEKVDLFEDKLGTYLVKISSQSLSLKDSREVSKLLHSIGNFERISDHALNIRDSAQEMHDKKISFTKEAQEELDVILSAVSEVLFNAIDAFERNDLELAKRIEPLEQVVDVLKYDLSNRHIRRLRDGLCTIEMGFIFSDVLLNLERIADHCSNIAVCMIETNEGSFDTHEYLHQIKEVESESFMKTVGEYSEKYALPQ